MTQKKKKGIPETDASGGSGTDVPGGAAPDGSRATMIKRQQAIAIAVTCPIGVQC